MDKRFPYISQHSGDAARAMSAIGASLHLFLFWEKKFPAWLDTTHEGRQNKENVFFHLLQPPPFWLPRLVPPSSRG
jgi:hypothetical protein